MGVPETWAPAHESGAASLSDSAHRVSRSVRFRCTLWSVSSPAGTTRSQRAESHPLLVLFIPQTESDGLQARDEGNRLDLPEKCIRIVAFLQMVVGNGRAQMMDMMKADIARKPLQDSGQLVERAPVQRSLRVIPPVAALPVRAFKLMLYVK